MPRAFTAIDIPADIAQKLSETQDNIDVGDPVKPEKMHITLEFFKNLQMEQAERIEKGLEKLEINPFEVEVKGLGVFPSKQYIRVIWAGIESENIEKTYQQTSDITPKSDNDHEFLPHVTISRVKDVRRRDKKKIHQALDDHQDTSFGCFKVEELKLYQSHLEASRSRYEELYVKHL